MQQLTEICRKSESESTRSDIKTLLLLLLPKEQT